MLKATGRGNDRKEMPKRWAKDHKASAMKIRRERRKSPEKTPGEFGLRQSPRKLRVSVRVNLLAD